MIILHILGLSAIIIVVTGLGIYVLGLLIERITRP